ncbi:MAG: DUF1761 domain-containing protein [Pseudomonadota bacterium]
MAYCHINHLAVWVAALVYFAIGGLWYAPFLFGRQWMALNRMSETDRAANLKDKGGMAVLLGISFVGGLVSLYVLAYLLSFMHIYSAMGGALLGLLLGLAFTLAPVGVANLFSARSFVLTLIDAGYVVLAFTMCGALLGAWR